MEKNKKNIQAMEFKKHASYFPKSARINNMGHQLTSEDSSF